MAAALVLVAAPALVAAQQDTTRRGVRIGLTYDPGTKPGVVVLPVSGAGGDSVREIVQRDLDYGDRVTVITADWTTSAAAQGATAAAPNYGLFAQLGAAAIVAATPSAGGLSVTLHDVGRRQVVNTAELPLGGATNSPEWRLAPPRRGPEGAAWIPPPAPGAAAPPSPSPGPRGKGGAGSRSGGARRRRTTGRPPPPGGGGGGGGGWSGC